MFLGSILLIYAFLPDRVGIHSNRLGMPDDFIARETFFWISLIVFVGSNALLYTLYKLLMLTRKTARTEQSIALRQDIGAWILGFAGTLNIFYVLAMAFFGLFNSSENYNIDRFMILVYAGPILMAAMFGLLVYILKKRKG